MLIIIQNTFISFNTKVYQIKHFISIKNVSLGHFRISQEERQWRSVSKENSMTRFTVNTVYL